jgi:hypothetical protein
VVATFSCAGGGPQSVPGGAGLLAGFRAGLYRCLTRRGDALFGLGDAVLCAGGRVTDLARLSLVPEFGRGHGALYAGLNAGRAEFGRLRVLLAGLPLPSWGDGRIRLAADVSSWLRPDAEASPGRLYCHVHGRGRNAGQVVPGWPYSFVAALGPGASSWTLPLDAVRLGPDDDECAVTAAQLRSVVTRLIAAGQWKEGDPEIVAALDCGYNASRLTSLLADLPLILVTRVRSGRVFYSPPPPRVPGTPGKPPRHGPPVRCGAPAAGWPAAAVTQEGEQARLGRVTVTAWTRTHQMIHRNCGGWEDWPKSRELPVIEGTLIRVAVTAPAPGRAAPEPMWLWASVPDAGEDLLRSLWTCYLRRFDLEHTFRFLKQQLGWTRPLLRDPRAADRWTWLLLACYAQLYLARQLAADIRLPWQPPQPAAAMTPARVRAGFRRVRETAGTPASPRKPSGPGPGRPKGSKNKQKAPRYPAGKTSPKKRKPAKKPRKQANQTG